MKNFNKISKKLVKNLKDFSTNMKKTSSNLKKVHDVLSQKKELPKIHLN